jgi:hypothetical protein
MFRIFIFSFCGKISSLGDQKNEHAKDTKEFLKRNSQIHHIMRNKVLKSPYLEISS